MGKIFALLGIIFGIIGLLAAIGIFAVMSPLPGQINDLATVELTQMQGTVSNFEDVAVETNTTFDSMKGRFSALSDMTSETVRSISEMGFGLEKVADDLAAVIPGIDVSRVKGAATLMKALDASDVVSSTNAVNAQLDKVKESVSSTTDSISRMKNSLIRVRGTIDSAMSMMSMFITLFSLFLAAVSLSLTFSAYMLYKKEVGESTPKNMKKGKVLVN